MIYLVCVCLVLAAIFAYCFYQEFKNAPEMWLCKYCHNEVMGLDFCPYCGTKKEEA